MTRATGRDIAIAATFMMKFVIIITKNAMPSMKTIAGALLNMVSQLTAIHFAAPVSHRQKPMDMAPAKSRIIFHGISSRSSMSRILTMKNMIVEHRRIPVLCKLVMAGINDLPEMTTIVITTIMVAMISWNDHAPSSLYILLALSRRPGMAIFSGLQTSMKKPQRIKVMAQPMGNI